MRTSLLLLALLAGARTSGAPVPVLPPARSDPPLCRVQAFAKPVPLGRRLTFALRPECPLNSVAHVRLSSRWGGSLPGNPPGVYTLRPGQTLTYTVLNHWWLDWRDRSKRLWRVPETPWDRP